ncbi:MAG: hypothetical protein ABSG91_13005, partial [Syntrophobacteraceae bacterium]
MSRFFRASVWFTASVFSFFICAFTAAEAYAAAKPGSLKVTILPSAAASADAQWTVDGGKTWHNSKDVVSGLTAGKYTVAFKTIQGWTAPANKTVTISSGATKTATGTYKQIPSSISVTISPPAAVSAGAQWKVDSSGWRNSGAKV